MFVWDSRTDARTLRKRSASSQYIGRGMKNAVAEQQQIACQ